MIPLKRWPAVERLLLAALEHPDDARDAYLDEACPEELRPVVRSLITRLDNGELDGVLRLDPEWLQGASAAVDLSDEPERSEDAPAERLVEIGPYRLICLIGRGGMGEVYLVERDSPGFPKPAALKVLRRDLVGEEMTLRFRRERLMLAAVEGPYTPRLLDAGTTPEGRPYYVMEYVEGEPITAYCEHAALDTVARLELFEVVCRAVAHVHDRLILHRDLKPGHIFVTRQGGAVSVKLLDFGIATVALPADGTDDAPPMRGEVPAQALSMLTLTQDGTAPFTSRYAAPEQRVGGPVAAAADVHALGVILCELLAVAGAGDEAPCGHAAWSSGEVMAEGDAAAPACALHEVCRQAQHPEPGARFASAEELAQAVRAVRMRLAGSDR